MSIRWDRAGLSALIGCASLLGACAPKTGLIPLHPRQVQVAGFGDDGDFRGMREAVEGSVRYFRRAPSALFLYGDLVYTSAEMEASMRLFLDITERLEGERRRRAIAEKFHFFESRNREGEGFFTGYYEPLLPASRTPREGFSTPLYAVPSDLLTVDLSPWIGMGLLPDDLENRILKGKVAGRRVVPYDSREEISYDSSLERRAEALAWVADEVELSFLQIQGSGMLRFEDGSTLRLNYADQNGHPYRAIGRVLLDRIPLEEMSLQRIREYLYAHPGEVPAILSFNPSYTFFRVVDEGPLGSIQVPLTPGRSVAMDSRLLPKGGLVYFETSYPRGSVGAVEGPVPLRRFGVVQDTGGAIRGHGRVDVFWGSGAAAERIAGPMRQRGRVWLLVARKEHLSPYLSPSEEPGQ